MELRQFEALTRVHYPAGGMGGTTVGDRAQIVASAHVVEQILDRVLPTWRTDIPARSSKFWTQHHEAAQRAIVDIERSGEIAEKLGDTGPKMAAAGMHPWIWDAARSLWQSGHFRQAVTAAAVKVNAEAQNKIGRRDISETDLFKQALSTSEASEAAPRLRLADDDGGRSAQSIRRGVMAYAEGCFAAIRNPASHDLLDDLSEAEALEQLAAFSLLARWIDAATVDRGLKLH